MNHFPLRMILLFDAAFLFVLGGSFVIVPHRAIPFFHFPPMPRETEFMVAMWGCVLMTLSIGYLQAVRDPSKNLAWLQVGIARGCLEVLVGLLYIARGIITWQQGWLGIAVGALVALVYLIFYPRGANQA